MSHRGIKQATKSNTPSVFLSDEAVNFEHMFNHAFYLKNLYKCIRYKSYIKYFE